VVAGRVRFCSIANLKTSRWNSTSTNPTSRRPPRAGFAWSPDVHIRTATTKRRVREIAPEANRQKRLIQVKVAIEAPDDYLRPETNAKVNFLEEKKDTAGARESRILIPRRRS